LRYRDLFDESNYPKAVELSIGRLNKDEIIEIPLKNVVKKVIQAYAKYHGWNYAVNANDPLFQTREHQIVSPKTWWRVLNSAVDAVGIKKNAGSESLRKTYGLNIFGLSNDKLNALIFLGELWGHEREGKVIKYLNLTDSAVDFDFYMGETFSLGDVDLSRIKCLKKSEIVAIRNGQLAATTKEFQDFTEQVMVEKKSTQQNEKETKTNRLWTKEKKLEVVLKYIDQHIPQKELAKQYGVDSANISRWVNEYKKYGASVFEDKRFKKIKG